MDYTNGDEVYVDDVPHAVRTYPASASSAMLPMNKANGWTATIMYCGGVDMADNEWTQAGKRLIDIPGSKSCVKISPDVSGTWEEDDDLPEGRVMGNGILLPDGTVLIVNGAEMVCIYSLFNVDITPLVTRTVNFNQIAAGCCRLLRRYSRGMGG